jgi:antitoxin component YwqK of YwqJK toxin-antitoxin module
MKNGEREGPWIEHHENGRIESKRAYKNGKREGPWVIYSPPGIKQYKSGTYRDGKKVFD